jgi:hypothetical protein
MAGIVELKTMLADNPQATEILGNIEATMTQNTQKVMDLEKQYGTAQEQLTETIQSRDKVKDVIRNELGIEDFTPDAIRNKLSSYGNEDAIAARDKQFNELKATSAQKLDSLNEELRKKDDAINDYKMKLAISSTDVMGQTKGEHANAMLLQWIGEDASFDEQGNIVYKGSGGETLYNENSNPLTLEDRINQIKADPARDFVFQQRFLAGGGAPTEKIVNGPSGAQSGGSYVRATMSFGEKKEYREKYGEEAYNKLPLA